MVITTFVGVVKIKKFKYPRHFLIMSHYLLVKRLMTQINGGVKMNNPKELIGVLQAISIVANNLADKLIRIEKEVERYEFNCSEASASQKK